jgi:DNA-binding GntR family transcriptional regulator
MNDLGPPAVEGRATDHACDPITLEIVRGALRATQSEMEALIERTAMSPFIREKKDFYAALFDGTGRLVVGSNLPIFGDVIWAHRRALPARDDARRRYLLVQ